ncbi:hypothetical protein BRARA_G00004 [Brassica rapa]|uniref:Uncharacterized protein n=1 Tax=Brassica campestris TaxID=3711 RepID=A0A397YGD7_BRACM|nr:hypothetical protein BRARA_G00004 [Brassica rapa]
MVPRWWWWWWKNVRWRGWMMGTRIRWRWEMRSRWWWRNKVGRRRGLKWVMRRRWGNVGRRRRWLKRVMRWSWEWRRVGMLIGGWWVEGELNIVSHLVRMYIMMLLQR